MQELKEYIKKTGLTTISGKNKHELTLLKYKINDYLVSKETLTNKSYNSVFLGTNKYN